MCHSLSKFAIELQLLQTVIRLLGSQFIVSKSMWWTASTLSICLQYGFWHTQPSLFLIISLNSLFQIGQYGFLEIPPFQFGLLEPILCNHAQVGHFFIYLVFSLITLRLFRKSFFLPFSLLLVFALTTEVLQYFAINRSSNLMDCVVNVGAVLIAGVLMRVRSVIFVSIGKS